MKIKVNFLLLLTAWLLVVAGCTSGTSTLDLNDLQQKATSGNAAAQRKLGSAYDFGHGVPQNYPEAARWYQLAADQGDAAAQNNLGSLYEHGLGVPTNLPRAAELYRKSADQNFAMAQNSLGRMYDLGTGIAMNPVEANSWYLRAANQGDAQAMFNLGVNYGFGRGVAQDRVEAFKWLDLARFFTQQSQDMQTKWIIRHALDDLKKLMTSKEIAQGENLSKEWDANYIKNSKGAN